MYRPLERMTKTCHLIVWLVQIYNKLILYALLLYALCSFLYENSCDGYSSYQALGDKFSNVSLKNLGCCDLKEYVMWMDLLVFCSTLRALITSLNME